MHGVVQAAWGLVGRLSAGCFSMVSAAPPVNPAGGVELCSRISHSSYYQPSTHSESTPIKLNRPPRIWAASSSSSGQTRLWSPASPASPSSPAPAGPAASTAARSPLGAPATTPPSSPSTAARRWPARRPRSAAPSPSTGTPRVSTGCGASPSQTPRTLSPTWWSRRWVRALLCDYCLSFYSKT
jgi:hypothetical protein